MKNENEEKLKRDVFESTLIRPIKLEKKGTREYGRKTLYIRTVLQSDELFAREFNGIENVSNSFFFVARISLSKVI